MEVFMSDKNKVNLKKDSTDDKQVTKKKSGYGNWLFRTKGTAAEPWPTAEELWEDPKVQEFIEAHNKSLKKINGS